MPYRPSPPREDATRTRARPPASRRGPHQDAVPPRPRADRARRPLPRPALHCGLQLNGDSLCNPHIVSLAGGTPGAVAQLWAMHADPSLHSHVFWQNWTEPIMPVGAGVHLLPLPETSWHLAPADVELR